MTRPRRRPFDPSAKIHDRKAVEVGRQSQVAPIVVDDPMGLDPGDKIAVMRNLRDDPLARLHSRKSIDDAQEKGGRAYQRDWETASRGPRAIDPGKEYVDGGMPPEPITEAQRKAVARLARIDRKLGLHRSALARDVLINKCTIGNICEARLLKGENERRFIAYSFYECLHTLAILYGFATERVHAV